MQQANVCVWPAVPGVEGVLTNFARLIASGRPSQDDSRVIGLNALSWSTYTPCGSVRMRRSMRVYEQIYSTYSMIRPQIIDLLVPTRRPDVFADKLDNVQRFSKHRSVTT